MGLKIWQSARNCHLTRSKINMLLVPLFDLEMHRLTVNYNVHMFLPPQPPEKLKLLVQNIPPYGNKTKFKKETKEAEEGKVKGNSIRNDFFIF